MYTFTSFNSFYSSHLLFREKLWIISNQCWHLAIKGSASVIKDKFSSQIIPSVPSRNHELNLILDFSISNRYIQFRTWLPLTWGCRQGPSRTPIHFDSTVPACNTSQKNSDGIFDGGIMVLWLIYIVITLMAWTDHTDNCLIFLELPMWAALLWCVIHWNQHSGQPPSKSWTFLGVSLLVSMLSELFARRTKSQGRRTVWQLLASSCTAWYILSILNVPER